LLAALVSFIPAAFCTTIVAHFVPVGWEFEAGRSIVLLSDARRPNSSEQPFYARASVSAEGTGRYLWRHVNVLCVSLDSSSDRDLQSMLFVDPVTLSSRISDSAGLTIKTGPLDQQILMALIAANGIDTTNENLDSSLAVLEDAIRKFAARDLPRNERQPETAGDVWVAYTNSTASRWAAFFTGSGIVFVIPYSIILRLRGSRRRRWEGRQRELVAKLQLVPRTGLIVEPSNRCP
jgi:hypothetical protein